ncbi:uncharacterized protein LOC106398301 [Brassica napus]|uniref:uncharacterized protein LOC106398301 n=1 Tax=Brassica napus TaxID=3708 RepID=UPI0006AAE69A|nr:uncharacterized protein LOC106398301 [Brassica napus]
MGKKSSVSILCFILISFSPIFVSAQTCDEAAGTFKPNSPYEKNRRLLNSTVASNVTAYAGYFNGSIGLGPDRVYALGMCAPGAEPQACSDCIQDASDSLLSTCLNQTDGFVWSGDEFLCLVRYSSKSLYGVLALEPITPFHNVMDIRKENQEEFDSVWDGLKLRMITRVSSSVRNNSSTSLSLSGKYYAKDVAPVPVYGNILMLMQCTPDISSNDCSLCLKSSVDYYKKLYHGKKGVIMLRPSCFFRWELYNFSGAFDHINDPPPLSNSPSVPNLTDITKKDKNVSRGVIAAIVVVIVVIIVLIYVGMFMFKRRKKKQDIQLSTESVQFGFKTIEAATSNFSELNKLGAGGFGEVYKGILMNGTEVAVKRLSKTAGQGEREFKNEVVVVAKLQHRNLVRLLGFSLQGEEKLLVYEFVPNKSLDYFLFDASKRVQLDWTMRHNIIGGISRGILYLHQDSRLKIIHRDLKASNILLDADMNPKIADFGTARIFGMNQTVDNTSRVVGTFGYMPPEYVIHGQFSMKSDVYSFGVMILEIISGKKNSSFRQTDGLVNNLVTYVWRLWENKSLPDLIDPGIKEDCKIDEVVRYIHIGLLCVQENPADRPTMSTIHQMLTTSSITLPVPLPPGFFFGNRPGMTTLSQGLNPSQSSSKSYTCSVDEATITDRLEKMCRTSLFPILLSVLVALCFISVSGQICRNTGGTFRPNTTYDSNRRLILSSLASNVTARGGFFYNSSFGQDPDRVYAMASCIPGAESKECSDCITEAVTKMIQNCPNQTEAFSWPGTKTLCMVRYANSSFYGSMDLEPNSLRYNTGNITINMSEFERIWDAFMIRMIDSASSGRSGASSSSSGKYYAADITSLTTFQRVYALMECTPDLSPGNCEACLRANVRRYQDCCRGNQGGVARRPSCFFRWDLYPFLGAFDNIISGAPPLQPLTGDGDGAAKKDGDSLSVGAIVGIVVASVIAIVLVLLALAFAFYRRRKSSREVDFQTGYDISNTDSLQFDFKTIEAATDKFSRSNMLGQGGFGEVFKGILPNGTEVAVKRLSKTSGQCALLEFKNEVLVVAKLQHRNLVRLLGFCLESEEKILVYEFVPNKSLDHLLFDPEKQGQLDWTMRYKIIFGIARGILYLHQDSRFIIIHRDLKPSNILLDADMNPKITDFGKARIISVGQTIENTRIIVGTCGYMSPEYAMHGQFSTKSDVYSFGVLVLEIINGKRNSSFLETESNSSNLVTYAWRLWRNGSPLELVDPTVRKSCDSSEVTRCIHIALLCVQENPIDRPTLSTIILMLTSNTVTLPVPHQPGFFFKSTRDQDLSAEDLESGQSTGKFVPLSINDETISELNPR